MDKTDKHIFRFCIISLYVSSLFLEAYSMGIYGIMALLFGGFSILSGVFLGFLSWCANILFFVILFRKLELSTQLLLSCIAVFLGALGMTISELPIDMSSMTSPVEVRNGYYFWLASLIFLMIKSLLEYLKR